METNKKLGDIKWLLLNKTDFTPVYINENRTGFNSALDGSLIFTYVDRCKNAILIPDSPNKSTDLNEKIKAEFRVGFANILELTDLDYYLEYSPIFTSFTNSIARQIMKRQFKDIAEKTFTSEELAKFQNILNKSAIAKYKDDERKRKNSEEFMKNIFTPRD